jgi:hypothetical protein
MSSLIATINRDRAERMKGIKSSVMAEPQLAIWSVQTVPGHPTMLSRMYPASHRDMTVIPANAEYPARRGPSALSLPLLPRHSLSWADALGGNVIRLT